jgi:hypothetical protein
VKSSKGLARPLRRPVIASARALTRVILVGQTAFVDVDRSAAMLEKVACGKCPEKPAPVVDMLCSVPPWLWMYGFRRWRKDGHLTPLGLLPCGDRQVTHFFHTARIEKRF